MFTLMAIGFGVLVGVALGLTGGGGSIFAVPLLIYGLHQQPSQAVSLSLAVVGVTALIGALHVLHKRLAALPPMFTFAAGGMMGAPLGVTVAHTMKEQWLLLGFAVLMLAIGSLMWIKSLRNPKENPIVRALPTKGEGQSPMCRLAHDGALDFGAPCALMLALIGFISGVLSGLFGVGGGFLIVPALVLLTGMSMHQAVASSLVIIAMISASGSAMALWKSPMDWMVFMPFVAGSITGMIAGRLLAHKIAGTQLQRLFATAIIAVGLVMVWHNISY